MRREQKALETELRAREAVERQSVLRGLILAAVVVLVVALFCAGAERVFPAGWLRRW